MIKIEFINISSLIQVCSLDMSTICYYIMNYLLHTQFQEIYFMHHLCCSIRALKLVLYKLTEVNLSIRFSE